MRPTIPCMRIPISRKPTLIGVAPQYREPNKKLQCGYSFIESDIIQDDVVQYKKNNTSKVKK